MEVKKLFEGVYRIDGKLAVKNIVPGFDPFSDGTVRLNGEEYLFWNPTRSKLGAAIVKGLKQMPVHPGSRIVYLGAAHGYTISKIVSIIGHDGIIYGVEFSERPFTELLPIAEKYGNVVPIRGDARKPETYSYVEKVDVVYCDIADPQMTEAAMRNARAFLKPDGFVMLAIKARSIDVTAPPKKIVDGEVAKLEKGCFEIVQVLMLDPLEKDHGFIVAKMK